MSKPEMVNAWIESTDNPDTQTQCKVWRDGNRMLLEIPGCFTFYVKLDKYGNFLLTTSKGYCRRVTVYT